MPEIVVRHSNKADIPAIKAIYEGRQAAAGTLQLPFASTQLWESRLETLPAGVYSLVAVIDGEVLGQLGLEHFQRPRRNHVAGFGMAVKDGFSGLGVGNQLLSAVTDLADNWLNIKRLEITVFTDNEAAIHLYQKHGFTIEGESPAYAFRHGNYASVYHMGRINQQG